MKTELVLRALVLGVALGGLFGCRGEPSAHPPVHLNRNMDTQDKYKPYRESHFFEDHRAMRTPPEGTVPWGRHSGERTGEDDALLHDDDAYNLGYASLDAEEKPMWVDTVPVQPSMELLRRGQQRFNIYCAPCHDTAGYGKGPVVLRNWPIPVPSYHEDRLRQMPVGQIYAAITYGVNNYNMPSYANQIPVSDRWAIVAYVRALQLSQKMLAGAGQ
ncbi:MAG: cytochrome c [Myxococcales bacterium]|nr:cytochrome c [Myxococcales bacterium]